MDAATARLQLIKMCLLTFLFANHYGEFFEFEAKRFRNKQSSMSIKFYVVPAFLRSSASRLPANKET